METDLSPRARARLKMLEWHHAHGGNVSRTARHFGFSRPTVYRWLRRFDRHRLLSLENRSSVPQRRRRRTWTAREAEAVQRRGRPTPAGARPRRPGDLVQLDTLDVRPLPGTCLKQFTACDLVSRWDVLELHRRATASLAVTVLDALAQRMPFPVRALQVDGGSECMAQFEEACRARGIRLFTLPPRSPKLNGTVERANRTHTEEFWELTDAKPSLEALRAGLAGWEVTHNTVRPHQALGYLTPAEYLASLGYRV